MKVLLDENIPHALRVMLEPHSVFTVAYLGWSGVQNGELLSLAGSHGFDVLITTDRGMEYEQNETQLASSVMILLAGSTKLEDLRPLVPQIMAALSSAKPRSLIKIQHA